MNIQTHSINSQKNLGFGHNNPWADSPYTTQKKSIVAGTTALGVASSMAILAKRHGYSLSPKKIFKNINIQNIKNTLKGLKNKNYKQAKQNFNKMTEGMKNSYWNKVEFDDAPVIAIGAGSCLGGLLGGFLIDKDKENRKAKMREALLQITNISLPIVFTVYAAKFGKKLGNKYWDKARPKPAQTFRTKIPQAIGGIGGLFAGVFTANIIANKINEKIFKQGKGRPVQASDFSAHLDDFCVAAQQISDASIVHYISRLVPLALMIAGNEVGNTTVENADS